MSSQNQDNPGCLGPQCVDQKPLVVRWNMKASVC